MVLLISYANIIKSLYTVGLNKYTHYSDLLYFLSLHTCQLYQDLINDKPGLVKIFQQSMDHHGGYQNHMLIFIAFPHNDDI